MGLPRLLTLTATNLGSGAFALTIIAAVFGTAATLDSLGVSMALGAFVLGVNLSSSIYVDRELKIAVDPAKQLLLGLFFITIGMALDWHEVLAAGVGPMLLLRAPPEKFAVAAGLGLALRFGLRASLLTAALLMPFDEVGLRHPRKRQLHRGALAPGLRAEPHLHLGVVRRSRRC